MSRPESELTSEEAEALSLMRQIVAEKGADYVYPESERRVTGADPVATCQYLRYDDGGAPVGPSCIVGHYLREKRVPLDDISAAEGQGAEVAAEGHGPRAVIWALADAQGEQDAGQTWGVALSAFEKSLRQFSENAR